MAKEAAELEEIALEPLDGTDELCVCCPLGDRLHQLVSPLQIVWVLPELGTELDQLLQKVGKRCYELLGIGDVDGLV